MERSTVPSVTNVDAMFSPAGLAVALMRGCELSVDAPGLRRPVYITEGDLTCAECDGSIDAPSTNPAKYIAYNKSFNDGLCAACDPIEDGEDGEDDVESCGKLIAST